MTNNFTFVRGMYYTDYDNLCYVHGPKATRAWDIDAQMWVPIQMVQPKFVRPIRDADKPDIKERY